MRASHRALLALVFVLGGCADLIGFPSYQEGEKGGGGSAGATSSSTGTGGAGGTGGATCMPGETRDCYTGDPSTEGIGACKPGTETCTANGWGPCTGEVLPSVEQCPTDQQDESCDGIATCTGQFRWAKRFGDMADNTVIGDDIVFGAVSDAEGGLVIAGTVRGALDLGGGPLMGGADTDILVARFDAQGRFVWAKRFGDANSQVARGLALDHAGNIVVAGTVQGSVDFGGGPLTSAGSIDAFVVKLDAQGGHVWSKRFGDDAVQVFYGVAIDSKDDVLLTGASAGTIDLGGGPLTGNADWDVIVAKLKGTDGGYGWAKRFGDATGQLGTGVAVDGADDVVIVGGYAGMVNLGGAAPLPAGNVDGDAFVAKLKGADGTHVWSHGYVFAGEQLPLRLAIGPDGSVVLGGRTKGPVDLGSGQPKGNPAGMQPDAFVLKLGADGAYVFDAVLGDDKSQTVHGLGVDGAGNILVAVESSGDIPAPPLPGDTSMNLVLLKYDAQGTVLWARQLLAPAYQGFLAATVDPLGNALLAGTFNTNFDLGGGPLVTAGGHDLFLAKLAP
jgi:hypothetical protein